MKISKRIYWFDLLKILACLMVITDHTIGYLLEYGGKNNSSVLFYSIAFSICKIGVPLFIMITGCLLLKEVNISYSKVCMRIKRIFFPLLFISAVYYFANNSLSFNNLFKFFDSFISGPLSTYLWYLYMLIGLYLISPFISKMIKNFSNNDYRNFILLFLSIPGIFSLLKIYSDLSVSNNFLGVLFPIAVVYYISGIYLRKIALCKKYRNLSFVIMICCFAFLTLSIYIPYLKTGDITYSLMTYTNIFVALSSFSIYYLFRYYFENKKISVKVENIIFNISVLTFGIYLFHNLISYRIYLSDIVQFVFGINSYVGVLFLILSCFIVSGIITYILRKLPIVKNYL